MNTDMRGTHHSFTTEGQSFKRKRDLRQTAMLR
jgi:hypothetical protein